MFSLLTAACLIFAAASWYADGFEEMVRSSTIPATILVWGWWIWVWPRLETNPSGLVIRNHLRTVSVPWVRLETATARLGLEVDAQGRRFYVGGVPTQSGIFGAHAGTAPQDDPVEPHHGKQTLFTRPEIVAAWINSYPQTGIQSPRNQTPRNQTPRNQTPRYQSRAEQTSKTGRSNQTNLPEIFGYGPSGYESSKGSGKSNEPNAPMTVTGNTETSIAAKNVTASNLSKAAPGNVTVKWNWLPICLLATSFLAAAWTLLTY